MCSAINNFLIVTGCSHIGLKNDILAMSSKYECLKTLKSVLKGDFFKLSSEKKHIMKKGGFLLTGSQTNVLGRIFFKVLKKFICSNEKINNFDNTISDPKSLIRKTWDLSCLDEFLMECSTLEHILEYDILNRNIQLNESIVNENNDKFI
uniref:Uncharacterized protein n=1 Tax=Strongyloides venezuelensis TaxID=75913 RepID=A0A0K0F0N9_STRVS